jgi:hypothetical protein
MAELGHSSWPASGFEQVMLCPGSRVLQRGMPRSTSEYAAEGTAAHQLLTWALQEGKPAAAYLGRDIEADGYQFTVGREMVEAIQLTIDYVADVAGENGTVLVDQRVHYGSYLELDEEQAWGTLDVAVLLPSEIVMIDLKYGRGVEVEAGALTPTKVKVPNPQLALYGLGALAKFKDLGGYTGKDVARLVIHQPRLNPRPKEFDLTIDELEAWAAGPARSAVLTGLNAELSAEDPIADWNETFLVPGDKQCRFCKAAATCPALRDFAVETITGVSVAPATPEDFLEELSEQSTVLTVNESAVDHWLAAAMSKADLIETWITAVRAETERRLLAGQKVAGFKLVQGRQGPRTWLDEKAAEEMLRKKFRLTIEEAYDLKLISPTSAEKLAKAEKIGKRQWPQLEALITRSPGKIHVAPVDDSRPAIDPAPVANDFEPVGAGSQFA